MKRNLMVLFVLSVFLIGSFAVLAEEGRDKDSAKILREKNIMEKKSADKQKDLRDQLKECTTEAKLCPDGSGVGRNPKRNCEFNPCPGEKDTWKAEKLEKKEARLQDKLDLFKERLDKAKVRKTELTDSAKELKDERCKAQKTLEGNCGKAFEKIKEHLTKTLDRMIEALTALKTKAEKNTLLQKENT